MREFAVFVPVNAEVRIGDTHQKLPLHCTIMPWAQMLECSETVIRETRMICANFQPFKLICNRQGMFGKHRDTPVAVLERTNTIWSLHMTLHEMFVDLGASFNNPIFDIEWLGPGYMPHVTWIDDQGLTDGDVVMAEKVFLAEWLPGRTEKKILSIIDL